MPNNVLHILAFLLRAYSSMSMSCVALYMFVTPWQLSGLYVMSINKGCNYSTSQFLYHYMKYLDYNIHHSLY